LKFDNIQWHCIVPIVTPDSNAFNGRGHGETGAGSMSGPAPSIGVATRGPNRWRGYGGGVATRVALWGAGSGVSGVSGNKTPLPKPAWRKD